MIPKKALLTGNLLEWQKANIKALLVMFEKHYGKESGDYDFWGWMYERLERNQKHIKQSLKLGHFKECDKDRKPLNITEESFYLESPENQKAFEQAENEVLFDYKKEDAFPQAEKWIAIYDTIEDYIKEENPAITDNYYNETFN